MALVLGLMTLPVAAMAESATNTLPASQSCAMITQDQVAGLFDRWNESLKTGDPEKVIANYAPNGILLPTLSNKMRTNHAEMKDYFNYFLPKDPQGTINERVIDIGCNTAFDAGIYTFKFKDGSESKARYSYVYEFQDGKWLISHHHSSVMPETTTTAAH